MRTLNNKKENDQITLVIFKCLTAAMAKVGVLKVSGYELENGQPVPMYCAVSPAEWTPEGKALMKVSGAVMKRIFAVFPKYRPATFT